MEAIKLDILDKNFVQLGHVQGGKCSGRNTDAGVYLFGFNGKEMDNEVSGNGNQYDYGFRIYNPRLGKFLSVDPLTKDYPSWTPYAFAMNRVIDGIDLDGLEYLNSEKARVEFKYGELRAKIQNFSKVSQNIINNQPWRPNEIGPNLTIGKFQLSSSNPSPNQDVNHPSNNIVSTDNTIGSPDPNNAGSKENITPLKKNGTIDKRYNEKNINTVGTPKGGSKAVKGIIALDIINWSLNTTLNLIIQHDINHMKSDLSYAKWAYDDINIALSDKNNTYIPDEYKDIKSIINIANVILQGENNTEDPKVYEIGMKIYNEISSKRFIQINSTDKNMDNYSPIQYQEIEFKKNE